MQFYTQLQGLVDPKAQMNNSCGIMLARVGLHLGENLVGSCLSLRKVEQKDCQYGVAKELS